MAGIDLYQEGAAMAPVPFPEEARHAAARVQLLKRLRPLLNSQDKKRQDIGFFLFGLAEALRARPCAKQRVGRHA
jgi:hypothetical protein